MPEISRVWFFGVSLIDYGVASIAATTANTIYYTLSTIAQTLAGAFALMIALDSNVRHQWLGHLIAHQKREAARQRDDLLAARRGESNSYQRVVILRRRDDHKALRPEHLPGEPCVAFGI